MTTELTRAQTGEIAQTATNCDIVRHDEALTPLQERGLLALLTTDSVLAAARKARVNARTLHRWRSEPAFRRAYLALHRRMLEQATGNLQQATMEAVDALKRNLSCGMPGVEVRAAQVILEQAARGVETMEFEERLHTLEEDMCANRLRL